MVWYGVVELVYPAQLFKTAASSEWPIGRAGNYILVVASCRFEYVYA